jgi:hypothetical protein
LSLGKKRSSTTVFPDTDATLLKAGIERKIIGFSTIIRATT